MICRIKVAMRQNPEPLQRSYIHDDGGVFTRFKLNSTAMALFAYIVTIVLHERSICIYVSLDTD